MTYKNNTYRNLTITSILTVILITSGIGLAYAADTEHTGTLEAGDPSSNNASGKDSAAFGQYNTASGDYSTAFGNSTTAQPWVSFVIGRHNQISGTLGSWVATDPLFVIGNGASPGSLNNALTVLKNGNVGIGISSPTASLEVSGNVTFGRNSNVANGDYSAAFGESTTASGSKSVAFGLSTTASGNKSVAFGLSTTASRGNSAAFGELTIANGTNSAAFGYSTLANGNRAIAFGIDTEANPNASFVLGRCNEVSGTTDSWVTTEPLFVIGNGDRSGGSCTTNTNAVTVLKNGNVGIGISNPGQPLVVNGIINSTSGGFAFPDGTTQTTAITGIEADSSTSTITMEGNGDGWYNCDAGEVVVGVFYKDTASDNRITKIKCAPLIPE